MHLQKAKSSNLERNNFSVRLRCDVLAHRSTNSRRVAVRPQGGPLTLQFLLLAEVVEAPATRKKCRDCRREQPRGVGGRFATLQHGDCAVCFVCLLPSYFHGRNCMKVHPTQNCYSSKLTQKFSFNIPISSHIYIVIHIWNTKYKDDCIPTL